MVDLDSGDGSDRCVLSRELLAQTVVDICMLKWESISDPALREEARQMGCRDWIILSSKMIGVLRCADYEVDSRAEYERKFLELIPKVPVLGMICDVLSRTYSDLHLHLVRSKLDGEQTKLALALVESIVRHLRSSDRGTGIERRESRIL